MNANTALRSDLFELLNDRSVTDDNLLLSAFSAVSRALAGMAGQILEIGDPTSLKPVLQELSNANVRDAIARLQSEYGLLVAEMETNLVRKDIVDEDTGVVFQTVEGGLSDECQEMVKGISMEDSNS